MGIAGLFQWLRNHHGSVIKDVHLRFADPKLKGKRVAIDGTLLTMAMHHGGRKKWGELAPKAALIGWYYLLEEMQRHSVQPYVIWDRKGLREWKSPEAKKRLFQRSLTLFRKEHEKKREQRLDQFKAIWEKWSAQPEEDKVLIRQTAQALKPLMESALTLDEKGKSILDVEALLRQATEAGQEAQVAALKVIEGESQPVKPGRPLSKEKIPPIVRANVFIKEWAQHVVAYSESIRKRTDNMRRKQDEQKVREAVEAVREMESMSDSLDSGYVERDSEEHVAEQEVIDEGLKAAILDEAYKETANQTSLTEEEGELLRDFFEKDILGTSDQNAIADAAFEKDRRDRQELLEQLRFNAPNTRQMYENALDAPTADLHTQCRNMIRLMGVPVLYARPPFEAEGLGAAMVKAGLADYVVTEDSDVLAYETPMVRNASGRGPLKIVDGRDVRESTGFSSEQYLDFCIMLGTDASPRLPGVGPVTASKLFRDHTSIEEVLQGQPKLKAKITNMDEFMSMVRNARNVFLQLPPAPRKDQLKPKEAEGRIEDWLFMHHQIDFRAMDSLGGTLESGTAPIGEDYKRSGSMRVDDFGTAPPMDPSVGIIRDDDFHDDYSGRF